MRYGMAIDLKKCVGCYNCFLTCRDEFAGNDYPGYSAAQPMTGGNWVKVKEIERGAFPHVKVNYIPVLCSHCGDPACVRLDQTGAIYRRDDGIVIIDPEKAKGNKELVNTCPYRRIEWNEQLQLPQKCTMCAHLLDAGEPVPRCVESCPSAALVFGDLDDPNSDASKLIASGGFEPLEPSFELDDKVLYRHIPRKFVAGTVIRNDIGEVAVGAEVTLTDAKGGVKSVQTDGFGDFEFEGLPENTAYTLRIVMPGYAEVTLNAKTSKDVWLGEINLAE